MGKSRLKIENWAHTHSPPTTSGPHQVEEDTESEKRKNQQKQGGDQQWMRNVNIFLENKVDGIN